MGPVTGAITREVGASEDPDTRAAPGGDRDRGAALEPLVELVGRAEPQAEEGTSYGMPAWRLAGKPLLGFKVAAHHIGLFPFSPAVGTAVRGRLGGFSVSKGGIRFVPAHPVPDDVVLDMLRLRRLEITRD